MIAVGIVAAPIDVAAELRALGSPGAVASFVGHVRADDGVLRLELEHYPGMTERALEALAAEACRRWSLRGVRVVHRVGPMAPGDAIVLVGTAADHRTAALDACAFLIDRLKTDAPFWKREIRAEGPRWVEAKPKDVAAAHRWKES